MFVFYYFNFSNFYVFNTYVFNIKLYYYILYIFNFFYRFFPSTEAYQSHIQLHEVSNSTKTLQLTNQQSIKILKNEESSKEVKREHFTDTTKSLTCPTCGKVNNFMWIL